MSMSPNLVKSAIRDTIEREGLSQVLYDVLDAYDWAGHREDLRDALSQSLADLIRLAGQIGQIEDQFPSAFDDHDD